MFCPKCRGAIEPDAKFCRECGTELDSGTTGSSERRSEPGTASKVLGALTVLVGLALVVWPVVSPSVEDFAFPLALLAWTVGLALAFSGKSFIVRLGKGISGAFVIMFAFQFFFYRGIAAARQHAATTNAVAQEVALPKLVTDYTENEVAADQHYKGQVIRTRGLVTDVKNDLTGAPFVLVSTSAETELRQVQCALASSATKDAARLSRGDSVTVQGRVVGLMLNVQMTDCTFVAPAGAAAAARESKIPSELAAMNAVAPAQQQQSSAAPTPTPTATGDAAPSAASSVPSPSDANRAARADSTWQQVEGASPERVRQLVGAPSLMNNNSRVIVWYYDGTPFGTVKVYFENGIASLDAPVARP